MAAFVNYINHNYKDVVRTLSVTSAFARRSMFDVWQGSKYASESFTKFEQAMVLSNSFAWKSNSSAWNLI